MSADPSGLVYVNSGDLHFSNKGKIVCIVGSCVSVVIYDERLKVGGVNHYLLPTKNLINKTIAKAGDVQNSTLSDLNYGDLSIQTLLKKFKEFGSRPEDLRAWIFGGSEGLSIGSRGPTMLAEKKISPGHHNIRLAKEILSKFKIKICGENIGESLGRRIELNLDEGKIYCAKMKENNSNKKFNLIVVDDSHTIRRLLINIYTKDPRIKVIGDFSSSKEAEDFVKESFKNDRDENKVNIVSLDLQMPVEDGISFFKRFLKPNNIPAVLVTDISLQTSSEVLHGLGEGIFDYFQKPGLNDFSQIKEPLCERLKLAAELAQVQSDGASSLQEFEFSLFPKNTENHRLASNSIPLAKIQANSSSPSIVKYKNENLHKTQLVVVGSSTGGTEALKKALNGLPSDHAPIVIIQHMPSAFTKPFSESLQKYTGLKVQEVVLLTELKPATVYLAAGGKHLKLVQKEGLYFLKPTDDLPVSNFKPSVDYFFKSLLDFSDLVKKTVAIILTGMGQDGAKGLLDLKNKGAFTITQHSSDCLVYGMPKVAFDMGASQQQMNLEQLNHFLKTIKKIKNSKVA
jgi:two-component system, chemotaxis family, protein-glutamate methylesterase/glutaminase